MQAVCVFCGSNSGARDSYTEAARDLGRAVAERGMTLVYGGAAVGLMGTFADAALAAGRAAPASQPPAAVKVVTPPPATTSGASAEAAAATASSL